MEHAGEAAARELLEAWKEARATTQTAKERYVAALVDQATRAEVMALLKHEYEYSTTLAKAAYETAQMAQRRLWSSPVAAASEDTQDLEDMDEEEKRLSILGKRARNCVTLQTDPARGK